MWVHVKLFNLFYFSCRKQLFSITPALGTYNTLKLTCNMFGYLINWYSAVFDYIMSILNLGQVVQSYPTHDGYDSQRSRLIYVVRIVF